MMLPGVRDVEVGWDDVQVREVRELGNLASLN